MVSSSGYKNRTGICRKDGGINLQGDGQKRRRYSTNSNMKIRKKEGFMQKVFNRPYSSETDEGGCTPGKDQTTNFVLSTTDSRIYSYIIRFLNTLDSNVWKIPDDKNSHNTVFKLLENSRSNIMSSLDKEKDLIKLQENIEKLTTSIDVYNIYKSSMSLLRQLTDEGEMSASEYLKQKSCALSEVEKMFLGLLDPYLLECIIIHVLSLLFNSLSESPLVKASTLIDQLDITVRIQISLKLQAAGTDIRKLDDDAMRDLYADVREDAKSYKHKFNYGKGLFNYLQSRNLIYYDNTVGKKSHAISKEENLKKSKMNYVGCNFHTNELPIRLLLPMVSKPRDWIAIKRQPKTLFDIEGGYLIDKNQTFRLLTSRNYDYFNIKIENHKDMCKVLSRLQSQPFKVNKKMLNFIIDNYKILEERGILMDRRLASLNLLVAKDKLRYHYF